MWWLEQDIKTLFPWALHCLFNSRNKWIYNDNKKNETVLYKSTQNLSWPFNVSVLLQNKETPLWWTKFHDGLGFFMTLKRGIYFVSEIKDVSLFLSITLSDCNTWTKISRSFSWNIQFQTKIDQYCCSHKSRTIAKLNGWLVIAFFWWPLMTFMLPPES